MGPDHAAIHVDNGHRATAALAVARGLAVKLGEHGAELSALGDGVPMAAVRRRDLIGITEHGHHAGRHSLLSYVQMKEAGHVTGLDQLAGRLLEQADANHAAVQVQNEVAARIVGVALTGSGRDRGVSHGAPDEDGGRRT